MDGPHLTLAVTELEHFLDTAVESSCYNNQKKVLRILNTVETRTTIEAEDFFKSMIERFGDFYQILCNSELSFWPPALRGQS